MQGWRGDSKGFKLSFPKKCHIENGILFVYTEISQPEDMLDEYE